MRYSFLILILIINLLKAQVDSNSIIITNPAKKQNNNQIYIQPAKENTIQNTAKKESKNIHILNKGASTESKGDAKLIAKLTVTKTSPKQILKVRKQMANVEKALSIQQIPVAINKIIKFKKGEELNIRVKMGFSTIVSFVDDAGNPITFTYLSIGNNFIKVTQFGNKLEIKPLRPYAITNLIVGIKGYDYPVTLNIKEVGDEEESYDNYIKVILTGTFQSKVGNEDIKLKSAILQAVFKYSNINALPRIDYEVYSLKTKKPILFSKDILKIYKVQKFGKTYYLILLNNNFVIYSNKTFGTYDAKYNIYFLNFNQNVFTIRTNPKLNMPYPMVERYRIVIKDF